MWENNKKKFATKRRIILYRLISWIIVCWKFKKNAIHVTEVTRALIKSKKENKCFRKRLLKYFCMGNLSLNNDAEMSLKHLRLHESYKTQTANDTKPTTTTQCSHCNSLSSSFLKNSEITRRNCVCHHKRSVNTQRLSAHAKSTMSNKFLLVYVIVFIASCPFVQCMRHQDTLNTNSLSQVTPSTNSIGSTATLNDRSETTDDDDSDNDEIEDSEEDQYAHTPAHDEVAKMYAKQFRAYPKNVPKKEDPQNSQLTTIKPQQTARQTASNSCSSSMCRTRQDIEEASTASIRKHILMKLGFEHEPNITKYPKLTEEYRKILCKLNNFSSEDCLGKKPPRVEYQSDEPVDSYDEYEADRDLDRDIVSEEEEDVQFLSYENRIYAFPSSKLNDVFHKIYLCLFTNKHNDKTNPIPLIISSLKMQKKKATKHNSLMFQTFLPCFSCLSFIIANNGKFHWKFSYFSYPISNEPHCFNSHQISLCF